MEDLRTKCWPASQRSKPSSRYCRWIRRAPGGSSGTATGCMWIHGEVSGTVHRVKLCGWSSTTLQQLLVCSLISSLGSAWRHGVHPSSESICTTRVEDMWPPVRYYRRAMTVIWLVCFQGSREGPSCHVGPQATTTHLGLDVLVPATWQWGKPDGTTNKDSSTFFLVANKTLSGDVNGLSLGNRFVTSWDESSSHGYAACNLRTSCSKRRVGGGGGMDKQGHIWRFNRHICL